MMNKHNGWVICFLSVEVQKFESTTKLVEWNDALTDTTSKEFESAVNKISASIKVGEGLNFCIDTNPYIFNVIFYELRNDKLRNRTFISSHIRSVSLCSHFTATANLNTLATLNTYAYIENVNIILVLSKVNILADISIHNSVVFLFRYSVSFRLLQDTCMHIQDLAVYNSFDVLPHTLFCRMCSRRYL